MTTWITSDLHFGHSRMVEHRGFASKDEHDDFIMSAISHTVRPGDTFIHAGDFSFRGVSDTQQRIETILKMGVRFVMVLGNHDKAIRKTIAKRITGDLVLKDIHVQRTVDKIKVVVCHFPMLSWEDMHHGSVMMHGHCHGNMNHLNVGTRRLDVGWDVSHCLLNLDVAAAQRQANPIHSVDHHVPAGM